MRQDVQTPRERFGMLVIDEQPDRCCVLPLVTAHAAALGGFRLRDYYTSGKIMAQAELSALEYYGHDGLSIFSEVGLIAEAMGSVFNYPEDDLPILTKPVAARDIDAVRLPDVTRDGRLPVYLEAIEQCYRAVADRFPILVYVPAPFTTGMLLADPNRFLMDTVKRPAWVKSLLDLTLGVTRDFCRAIADAGGLPLVVDPLASSSVISPRAFRTFALPYERALIDFLHRYDFDVILHICGNTMPILDLLPATGADLISVDKVDMKMIRERLDNRLRIVGNYDTSHLAFGEPGEIGRETEVMVRENMYAKRGYIAATGCEVPIRTPPENVKAFIKAAKETGWYWE